MGDILVGTCSWTDPALVRSGWYPRGQRDAEGRLRYYARRFPLVEADSGYYALPQERTSRLWAERTPDGFVFDVKAFAPLTGHPVRPQALPQDLRGADPKDPGVLDDLWARFADGIAPLRRAGRLGSVLFQFPPWFRPGPRAEAFLAACARRTQGWPVAVEFRHPDWWRPAHREATRARLADHGFAAVAVDMAQSPPTAIPPVTPVTTPRRSVVRFHGRSTAWGTGSKEDRFRHTYTEAELAQWVPRLRALAGQVTSLHVLFNNCCADAAVRAAQTMADLLQAPVRRTATAAGPSPARTH
ncbi:DUF72 domain-containing protein [Streptomyces mexicanus]|uniref:DUF72 domain-containing protein n=1 Tax=Streptomyces mexicanus TaxID=178566 RepID=UPI0036497A72